ncbi:aminopeptidase I zinc metalloprotease [Phlyctema vagabunda]|uniref:aspartyl aminopeptidase n=1 Tax=Phlyctema vagabunda TaxID=108571 RepID=A0ABR4PY39_9HELO
MFAKPLRNLCTGFSKRPLATKRSLTYTHSYNMAPQVSASRAKAQDFLDFVNASPTPFHSVRSAIDRLSKAGFQEIKERDPWSSTLQPGGKYYMTRNGSTIVAFAIGEKWRSGNPIAMIGAHTDSPTLRIKPVSKKTGSGFIQVGVETYGGGIWHTWFDRDLSIAGRAMVKDSKGNFAQKLIKIERPIVRIPTLAIHLDRSSSFDPNKETELFPIAGLVAAELNRTGASEGKEAETTTESEEFHPLKVLSDRHHPYIVELIANEAGVAAEDVVDFECVLYDTQKGCFGGLNDELIYSARLDNQGMTYCSVMGLIESVSSESALKEESAIRLIACFDHEEVGSLTMAGANSNLLPAVLRRLSVLPAHHDSASENSYEKVSRGDSDVETSTVYEQTLATSFLISADMAHSVNPNYAQKYESDHRPEMNKGTVIKINANQRYTTNSPGIVLIQEVARRAKPSRDSVTAAGVPLQLFVVRNDSPCGGTIGPMLSAKLGARTLDLGNPQLSMHSIRECGGAYDVEHGIRLFESFFEHFSELEPKILVD